MSWGINSYDIDLLTILAPESGNASRIIQIAPVCEESSQSRLQLYWCLAILTEELLGAGYHITISLDQMVTNDCKFTLIFSRNDRVSDPEDLKVR